jgi:t-SNARE complex subunit (syntaxin)
MQQQQQHQINLAGGHEFRAESADDAIISETNAEVAALNRDMQATAEAMRDIQDLAQQQGVQLDNVEQEVKAADTQVEEGVHTLSEISCCKCCMCWKCCFDVFCPSF